jgi:hypothetical protein
MAQAAHAGTFTQERTGLFAGSPAHQAYRVLQLAFVVAPIVAGADKFFHFLVNWDQYLAPVVDQMLGGNGHLFMLAVGAIEIVAGIGVAIKPKVFAYVVAAWLLGIVVSLLLARNFYDIALRDVGLALGALALARLSHQFDTGWPTTARGRV